MFLELVDFDEFEIGEELDDGCVIEDNDDNEFINRCLFG